MISRDSRTMMSISMNDRIPEIFRESNIKIVVLDFFRCPEILTTSSNIFREPNIF